jgi:hypothetical protein
MNPTIVIGVVMNILSTVGVVITNKYITGVDGYNYMIFLSFLHFAATALGTRVLLACGVFTYRDAPMSAVLPVSVVSIIPSLKHLDSCGLFLTSLFTWECIGVSSQGSLMSVAFMNLNLANNSVGFYQVCNIFYIGCNICLLFIRDAQQCFIT